tara:strand:+ start:56 stop:241 length:186 start_codon:yes stop_codon:yes gene_type:complete
MNYKKHVYFFGVIVFISALLTGTCLICNIPYYKTFLGILIIAYTMLNVVTGIINENERENI